MAILPLKLVGKDPSLPLPAFAKPKHLLPCGSSTPSCVSIYRTSFTKPTFYEDISHIGLGVHLALVMTSS